jgi:hypothetical protein
MFTFRKLRDRLYELQFDDRYELCMAFLRYEEFYESPKYAGRKFTLAEYMSWYVKNYGKDGGFSYPFDWAGFNMPADTIKKVHEMGIDDPNHYDSLMLAVYRMISAQCDNAYLIGVTKGGNVGDHEITHAMYCIDDVYRNGCIGIIIDANSIVVNKLERIMGMMGYGHSSYLDEMQAYITTDDGSPWVKSNDKYFVEITAALAEVNALPACQELKAKLKEHHSKFFPGFVKDMSK